MKKIGIILANLGTPDSPSAKAVTRYLWQFLTDPRVVDLPRWKWYPLLKYIILPRRSKRIAKTIHKFGQKKVLHYWQLAASTNGVTAVF